MRAIGCWAMPWIAWAAVAVASSPVTANVDAVYRALDSAQVATALAASAGLLADQQRDPQAHADALQARLDVLAQEPAFDAAAVQPLQEAIAVFVAKHPQYSALLERLVLARAVAAHDAGAIAASVDRIAAMLPSIPAAEQAESRGAAALALPATANERARWLAQPALEFWQHRTDAKAAWRQAQLCRWLAQSEQDAGNDERALQLLENAALVMARVFGVDSNTLRHIDDDRAGVLSALGRYGDKLRLREAELEAMRERHGADSLESANAEAMLGAALQESGDYAKARAHYTQALAVFAHRPDAPTRKVAIVHANFGNLLQEMGDTDEALANYRRALELFGSGTQATRVRAIVLANIGNTQFRQHHFDVAKTQFAAALALREKADGVDSPGLAFALDGLGSTSLALRDYAQAEMHFSRALDLLGRTRASNHPTLGPLRFGLALARWGQGDERGAFAAAVQTARHQQLVMASFASDSAERQAVAFRQLQVPATALVVTLAAHLGDASSIDTAWQLVMAERGLIARTQAQRLVAARAKDDPRIAAAFARWQRLNRALGEAWLAVPVEPARLAGLREEAEAAERQFMPRVVNATVALRTPTIAALAKALPADGMLIAYSEGVAADPARLLIAGQQMVPEDRYAFMLDGRAAPRLVRVGAIRALSAQIHAWYKQLREPASDTARLRRNGLELRRALFDSLDLGHPANHVFVVPEGELYRASFAALPAPRGGGYLIESVAGLHTLAQESDLLDAPVARTDDRVVLLAGAPRLNPQAVPARAMRSSCRRMPEQFPPIPNAGRELEQLRTVFANAPGSMRVNMLRGDSATHTRVLAALARANVAHLATHGFAYDSDCDDASGRRGVSLAAVADDAERPAESMLSGLALTSTDARQSVDVLGADELATVDLRRLDWIVLSACDSGLGIIGRNEGVFGMRRALRMAGARTVVMSLWPVDDASTTDLMHSLYRARFIEHRDVPDAMGQAMRTELARRRAAGQSDHPFYWAAFVSEGGWR